MMNIKNEEIAREKTGQSLEDLEALSPEQIRQTLHELRVQQIELKMQNEQLQRAEEDLRNQNALLNAVINSAKDIILVALDKNYCYVAFNERHRQEMKAVYNVDIEIGQCMLDFITVPEVKLLAKASYDRVLKGESFTEIQRQPNLDIWYEFFWNPIWTTAGEIDGINLLIRGVTKRKQAADALQESEANLCEAQEIARMGRWELDLVTNNLMWSDGIFALFEISRETFAATYEAFLEFVHPDDRSLVDRAYRESVESKTPYEIEHRLLMKDGRVKWVNEIGRTAYDDAGNPIRSVGTVQDITERKRAEEELQEIEQLKEKLERENVYLREEVKLLNKHAEIVGESKAIRNVLVQAEQVGPTDSTVLILGETGTGKELLAHTIHDMSNRKDRALVMVNCASLPPTLIESELFGREKGAYTGALTKMTGRFEVADGSTLFLDEIGDLPLELQSKLLRVLEQGQFERLGSTKTIRVNVRIIAATNHDLSLDVREGRFRKDLYYRLNVFPITVPPLRERKGDIPSLVWSFVKQFEKTLGKRIESIPKKKMEALMHYPWPGNIRELRNVIEHAMIMSSSKTLDVEPPDGTPREQSGSNTLADMERRHILTVHERTGWRISGKNNAAGILGMNRTTLQSKMKALGITRPVS